MHRIRRQTIELELPHEAGAVALQRAAGRAFIELVTRQLEPLFDRLAPPDRIVRIDRIEIDLGVLPGDTWENEFLERCVVLISRQLDALLAGAVEAPGTVGAVAFHELAPGPDPSADDGHRDPAGMAAVIDPGQDAAIVADYFLQAGRAGRADHRDPASTAAVIDPGQHAAIVVDYFLQAGTLPWYAHDWSLRDLEAAIEAAGDRRWPTLLPQFGRMPVMLERLVRQFSQEAGARLLEKVTGLPAGGVGHALAGWRDRTGQAATPAWRLELFRRLLHAAAQAAWSPGSFGTVAEQWLTDGLRNATPPPHDTGARPPRAADAGPLADHPEAGRGLWVDLAGLVLLAPYLPSFFTALDIRSGRGFTSDAARHRALHLLYFLGTGHENPEEPALALPKVLCGMPPTEPAIRELALRDDEKDEAGGLLDAVIANWPALKNTGPAGLREAFLQRSGLLSYVPERQSLVMQIERRAHDILLERLPWSISAIRLPWMNEMLQVEW